jgi:acyl-CoA synthetase (AMP-forming)/AMP-acid ligase II
VAWLSPPGSVYAVAELWPFLSSGASVHVAENLVVAVPSALREWIDVTRVTACCAFLPLGDLLLKQNWPADTSLRRLIVVRDSMRDREDFDLPFEVVFEYGATEVSGVSTLTAGARGAGLSRRGSDERAGQLISRPWPGVELFVVDERMRPVAPGQSGELCVSSPALARSYHGDPRATAERFVPAPSGKGARMYRTGDLVRGLPDGGFEHHGPARVARMSAEEALRPRMGRAALSPEEEVLRIWCEKLGLDSTRPLDDFLEAGGDSLRAGLIVDALYERFGVRIRLRDFFRNPRPAALAEIISRGLDDRNAPASGEG